MFNKIVNAYADSHAIDIRIEELKTQLRASELGSDDQTDLIDQLEDMIKLRDLEEGPKEGMFNKIDLTTLVSNAVGFVSLAMILEYEKTDIIATKGLSIATKLLGKK